MKYSNTFTTHADLAYDVTDTDCWAQSSSTHGRVLAIFDRRHLVVADFCLLLLYFMDRIQTHKR